MPNTAPSSSPPKNQLSTTTSAHAAAERKNAFGRGKKETNTGGSFSGSGTASLLEAGIAT